MFLWEITAGKLVDRSISTVDNVEHFFYEITQAHSFEIRIKNLSANLEEYGLTWWSTPVPEPITLFLLLFGLPFLINRRRNIH